MVYAAAQRPCQCMRGGCRTGLLTEPQASEPRVSSRPRILLAASGSVAAIKLPEIAAGLVRFADVRVLLTVAARHFVSDELLPAAALPVYGALCPNTDGMSSIWAALFGGRLGGAATAGDCPRVCAIFCSERKST